LPTKSAATACHGFVANHRGLSGGDLSWLAGILTWLRFSTASRQHLRRFWTGWASFAGATTTQFSDRGRSYSDGHGLLDRARTSVSDHGFKITTIDTLLNGRARCGQMAPVGACWTRSSPLRPDEIKVKRHAELITFFWDLRTVSIREEREAHPQAEYYSAPLETHRVRESLRERRKPPLAWRR